MCEFLKHFWENFFFKCVKPVKEKIVKQWKNRSFFFFRKKKENVIFFFLD